MDGVIFVVGNVGRRHSPPAAVPPESGGMVKRVRFPHMRISGLLVAEVYWEGLSTLIHSIACFCRAAPRFCLSMVVFIGAFVENSEIPKKARAFLVSASSALEATTILIRFFTHHVIGTLDRSLSCFIASFSVFSRLPNF